MVRSHREGIIGRPAIARPRSGSNSSNGSQTWTQLNCQPLPRRRRWQVACHERRTDLEAYGIEDLSFVIDKRQRVLSGYRLPQQRPCHRAQLLSIEYPALCSACVISHKDDTLLGRWDVWIKGDHLPRHRRSDLRETSGQMCSRPKRLRFLKKPLVPLGLDVAGKACLALYYPGGWSHG